MEKELFDYVAERAQILATTGASKQETKDAANAWLEATAEANDDAIEAATQQLVDYLDGRPNTIDGVIAFAQSPVAVEMFGEEGAAQMLANMQAAKEAGAKFCACDACTAASQILAKFGRVEL